MDDFRMSQSGYFIVDSNGLVVDSKKLLEAIATLRAELEKSEAALAAACDLLVYRDGGVLFQPLASACS